MIGDGLPVGSPCRRHASAEVEEILFRNVDAEGADFRMGRGTDDNQETLPLFSSEEEAKIILRFGGATGGWRARESGAGELVSVLSGPCAGVKKVALDPSPEMVVEGTIRLVSLPRESFMNLIMARRSGPPRLGEPEERSSTDHSLEKENGNVGR